MTGLRHVVALVAGSVIGGVLLVAVLVAGWVGWLPTGGAILAGLALAWPVSALIARRIEGGRR